MVKSKILSYLTEDYIRKSYWPDSLTWSKKDIKDAIKELEEDYIATHNEDFK